MARAKKFNDTAATIGEVLVERGITRAKVVQRATRSVNATKHKTVKIK